MQRRSFLLGAPLVIAGATGLLGSGRAFAATLTTQAATPASSDESAIQAAVLADVQQRASLSLNGGTGASARMQRNLSAFATQARASTLASQAPALATQMQLLAQYGEAFSGASSAVSLSNVEIHGSSATADVVETTTMTRQPINGEAQPDYAYSITQHAELVRTGSTWLVNDLSWLPADSMVATLPPSADTLQQWSDPSVQQTINSKIRHGVTRNKALIPDSLVGSAQPPARPLTVTPDTSWYIDTSAIVSYAYSWYNAENGLFQIPEDGDDCTDFASQCLNAGGWPLVNGNGDHTSNANWFNYPVTDGIKPTYSWGDCDDLLEFAVDYHSRFFFDVATPVWQGGDIAFWIWDGDTTQANPYNHASVCTKVTSGGTYFCQHTPDQKDVSYAYYVASNPNLFVADAHPRTTITG